MKTEYAEEVAARIIEQLKQGTAPWQKPWKPGELRLPYNPTTGKEYRGMNSMWLHMQGYSDPRWMTYNQAGEAGAQVRRGAKGTHIVYWKFTEERKLTDDKGKPVLDADGKPRTITVELERPRSFTAVVFNAEQIDGLPPLEAKQLSSEPERHARAETILANSGAQIEHVAGDRAFYRPSTDSITLPERAQFPTADGYYATALHELGHWTGHPSRMDRDLAHPFGSEGYAREELRAEIASLMLGERLEIGHDPGQHAAYVGSWIKKLEEDPREIFRAAADAEKIASYVLDFEQEKTMEKEAQQPAVALSPAQERAMDLLRQSTLTPGTYAPTPEMRGGEHLALAAGVVPLMVLGPADDAETAQVGWRLIGSSAMAGLVHAAYPEFDGPLNLYPMNGAQVTWHTAMPALVSKPAGQVEQGDESGPLVAVMLDPERGTALAVGMATNNEVLHCIDPAAPQIEAVTDEQRRTLELLRANERPMVPVPPIVDADLRVANALRETRKAIREGDYPEQGNEAFAAAQDFIDATREAFGDPIPHLRSRELPFDWTGRTLIDIDESGGPEPSILAVQDGKGVFWPFESFPDERQARMMADRLAVIAAYAEDSEHERTAAFARIHEDRVRNNPKSTNDQKVAAKEMRKLAEGIAMQHDAELQAISAEAQGQQGRDAAAAEPETHVEHSAPNNPTPGRVYLAVPFKEKDAAKAAAREAGFRIEFDRDAKAWWAPEGADLSKLAKWRQDAPRVVPAKAPTVMAEQAFADAIRAAGIDLEGPAIMDGQMHRLPLFGEKGGKTSGAYVGHLTGVTPGGYIQNFKSGEVIHWKPEGAVEELTNEQRAALRAEAIEHKAQRDAATAAKHEATAKAATALWAEAPAATAANAYCKAKGIEHPGELGLRVVPDQVSDQAAALGIKIVKTAKEAQEARKADPEARVFKAGDLLVPGRDLDGKIWTLQSINPYFKSLMKGGRKQGVFAVVGGDDALKQLEADPKAPIVFGEGYATCNSVSRGLDGKPVIVAFDSGNYNAVVGMFRERYPDRPFVIAADNDHLAHTKPGPNGQPLENVGLKKAYEVAKEHGAGVAAPQFKPDEKASDWNDFESARGRDELRKQLGEQMAAARIDAAITAERIASLAREQEMEARNDPTTSADDDKVAQQRGKAAELIADTSAQLGEIRGMTADAKLGSRKNPRSVAAVKAGVERNVNDMKDKLREEQQQVLSPAVQPTAEADKAKKSDATTTQQQGDPKPKKAAKSRSRGVDAGM